MVRNGEQIQGLEGRSSFFLSRIYFHSTKLPYIAMRYNSRYLILTDTFTSFKNVLSNFLIVLRKVQGEEGGQKVIKYVDVKCTTPRIKGSKMSRVVLKI